MHVKWVKMWCEKGKKISDKEQYQNLIKARNFHSELFNKWMTYFYVVIGALFVCYYTLINASSNVLSNISSLDSGIQLLSLLGYITSLFWYWVGRGHYFWVNNYSKLLINYEVEILKLPVEKGIYSVFYNKSGKSWNSITGANFSTSKISILLSFIITLVWGSIFTIKSFNYCALICYLLEWISWLPESILFSWLLGSILFSWLPESILCYLGLIIINVLIILFLTYLASLLGLSSNLEQHREAKK